MVDTAPLHFRISLVTRSAVGKTITIIVQFFPAVTNDFLFLCLWSFLSPVTSWPPSCVHKSPVCCDRKAPPVVDNIPIGVNSEASVSLLGCFLRHPHLRSSCPYDPPSLPLPLLTYALSLTSSVTSVPFLSSESVVVTVTRRGQDETDEVATEVKGNRYGSKVNRYQRL